MEKFTQDERNFLFNIFNQMGGNLLDPLTVINAMKLQEIARKIDLLTDPAEPPEKTEK